MPFPGLILWNHYIYAQSIKPAPSKSQFDTLNCTLEELAIIKAVNENPHITQAHLPLTALYSTRLIQVRTKTAEKFLTYQAYLPLTALHGTCLIQVRTKTYKKVHTWQVRYLQTNFWDCSYETQNSFLRMLEEGTYHADKVFVNIAGQTSIKECGCGVRFPCRQQPDSCRPRL